MQKDFSIATQVTDRGHIVALSGDATVDEADSLRDALFAVARANPTRVILDLTNLTFVTSLGLGIILEFRNEISHPKVELRLAGASPEITDVFKKTRLSELFPMYDSVEHALADAG